MGRLFPVTVCLLVAYVCQYGVASPVPDRIEVPKSEEDIKTLATKLEKLRSLLEKIVSRQKPERTRALESSMSGPEIVTPPSVPAVKPRQEVPTPPGVGVAKATASPNTPFPMRGPRDGGREGVKTEGKGDRDEEGTLRRLAEGLAGGEKTAFDSLTKSLAKLLGSGQGDGQLAEDMDDLGKVDTTGEELGRNRPVQNVKTASQVSTHYEDMARLLDEMEKGRAQSKLSIPARSGSVSRMALQKVEYALLRALYEGLTDGVTLQDILDDIHKSEQTWTKEKEIEDDLGKLVRMAGSK